jgi:hypothetical protein
MNYRGIEFRILQTIPRGFRWSVQTGKGERFGTASVSDREEAIRRAKAAIDYLLRRGPKPR